MAINRRVFKDTVLLILELAGEKGIGAVKLNKCLLINDALYNALHGKSLTGTTYIKDKYGPVPDKEARDIISQMIEERDIIISKKKWSPGKEETNHALSPGFKVSKESFEAEEINRLSQVVETIMKMSAEELSKATHDYEYRITKDHEEIDLSEIVSWKIEDASLSDDEYEKAKKTLEENIDEINNMVYST